MLMLLVATMVEIAIQIKSEMSFPVFGKSRG